MGNYLYNGKALPPILDWNGETHPYVYISYNPIMTYMYRARKIQYGTGVLGYEIGMIDGWSYSFVPGKYTDWEITRQWEETRLNSALEHLVWANFDVLNEDGSIYLPASYPVDEETGETITTYGLHHFPVIDYSSLIQGWLVGRAIASQHKKQPHEPTDVPNGVLISSDGYILCDSSGLYLIAKEDA